MTLKTVVSECEKLGVEVVIYNEVEDAMTIKGIKESPIELFAGDEVCTLVKNEDPLDEPTFAEVVRIFQAFGFRITRISNWPVAIIHTTEVSQ